MRILALDDEPIALQGLMHCIRKVCPDAEVLGFESADAAACVIGEKEPDVIFADIRMPGTDGVTFAKRILEQRPGTDIVFTTGYSKYMEAAFDMYASGYLMKPVTPERVRAALENLRYHRLEISSRLQIRCFGNFEVLYRGEPLSFSLRRTKELFAYLVDRRGAQLSTQQIESTLFEDDRHEAYIYKLRADLLKTLEKIGCGDAVNHRYGLLWVVPEKVDCDYFSFLRNPKRGVFHGEYMSQFSWAEETLAILLKKDHVD